MLNTKLKQQAVLVDKDERKLAALEAQKIKEKTFKLMVKIISWKSGASESIVIKSANKITSKEWLLYKRHRMGIVTAFNKEEAKEELAQTYNSIKANGGFE